MYVYVLDLGEYLGAFIIVGAPTCFLSFVAVGDDPPPLPPPPLLFDSFLLMVDRTLLLESIGGYPDTSGSTLLTHSLTYLLTHSPIYEIPSK
jgi:hypothetical protein